MSARTSVNASAVPPSSSKQSSKIEFKPHFLGEQDSRQQSHNGPGSVTQSTSSLHTKSEIFSITTEAPAPETTFYQLLIPNIEEVHLRDWPKPRFSSLSHSKLTPGEIKITMSEFLAGEWKEKLIYIFGEYDYERAKNAATEAFLKEDSEQN